MAAEGTGGEGNLIYASCFIATPPSGPEGLDRESAGVELLSARCEMAT